MPPSTRSTVFAVAALPVPLHRVEQVAGLEGDRFQRGAGEFGRAGVARQAEDRAARLGIPMRRAEAGEGRHEIDALRVGSACAGKLAAVGALPITFSPSRSHCTAAPAMKIEPSSA